MHVELTDKQSEAFRSRSRYLLLDGGMGSGKTWTMVLDAIRHMEEVPGIRILFGRLDYQRLKRSAGADFYQLIPRGRLHRRNDVDNWCEHVNGSQLFWQHLGTPSIESALGAIKGMTLGRAYIDQADECDARIFDALRLRLRQDVTALHKAYLDSHGEPEPVFGYHVPGIWLNANPEGHDWLYERFFKQKDPQYQVVRFSMLDNAANLPQEYIDDAMKLPPALRSRYVFGNRDALTGKVFEQPPLEGFHVIEPFEIPPEWPRWRAIDHGRRDPTCCLWIAQDPEGNHYVYDCLYQAGLIAHNAEEILKRSYGETYEDTLLDPSVFHLTSERAGSYISDADLYEEAGLPVSRADNDMSGIERIGQLMLIDPGRKHPILNKFGSPRLFFFRVLAHELIEEIERLKWKEGAAKQLKRLSAMTRGADHAVDALRYYVNATWDWRRSEHEPEPDYDELFLPRAHDALSYLGA